MDLLDALMKLSEEVVFARGCCDSPQDVMYHAKDKTWWKRVKNSWRNAEPPEGWYYVGKDFGTSDRNYWVVANIMEKELGNQLLMDALLSGIISREIYLQCSEEANRCWHCDDWKQTGQLCQKLIPVSEDSLKLIKELGYEGCYYHLKD